MKFRALLFSLVAFGSMLCGSMAQAQVTNPTITIGPTAVPLSPTQPIVVTLNPTTIAVGTTSVAIAQLQLSDGTLNAIVTNECAWSSSDVTKATVTGNIVTGVAGGTAVITCTDMGQSSTITGSATITVAAQPFITAPSCGTPPCPLPGGVNGTPYSFTFLASGGTPPYTWTVSTGSIPGWASLNASTGVLSGTPNANATTSFTIEVTDSVPNSTTLAVSLTVTASATCGTGSPLYNYCARSDTAIVPGPNLPPFVGPTGAGTSVIDDMNAGMPGSNYMLRVTDFNTDAVGVGFTVDSSSTARQWNSTSTIFHLQRSGGDAAFFALTPGNPPSATYKGHASADSTGINMNLPQWSANISNQFFSGGSNGGAPNRSTLNLYNLNTSAGTWNNAALTATIVLDPINCPGLTAYNAGPLGTIWNRYYAENLSDASSDKLDHAYAMDYRFTQDDGSLIIVYDATQTAPGCRWLDTKTMQIGGSYGPTGQATGFGPLPAPAAPTVTGSSTGGNLLCGVTLDLRLTYTVTGHGGYAGESVPGPVTTFATTGTGSTCAVNVAPPTPNPGGGSGINLSLTATGYNVYACQHVFGACPSAPVMQTNGTNSAGALALPVILTGTCANTGTTTYTYYLVAGNAQGNSATSAPFTVPGCASKTQKAVLTWAPIANCGSSNTCTYYVARDSINVLGVQVASSTCSATVCTATDNSNTVSSFVNQTTPIATTAVITSLSPSPQLAPTINSAGVTLHNFRMDESGQYLTIEIADRFVTTQGSPANAPLQISWRIAGTNLVTANPSTQTAPTLGYASAHWTTGFGTVITWPQGSQKASGVVTSLTGTGCPPNTGPGSCVTTMNNTFSFLNAANGALDTQTGDQHLSHANSVNATPDTCVIRNSFNTTNLFVLPKVPYNGEIICWAFAATATNPSANAFRFGHNWTSASAGFNTQPRGGISQDGKHFFWVSDMLRNGLGHQGQCDVGLGRWDGVACVSGNPTTYCALGSAAPTPTSPACRWDVFLLNLTQQP